MIQVPKVVFDDTFDNEITRGSVVLADEVFKDGAKKKKYFIILNNIPSAETIIYTLTTSQLSFYNKHPNFNKDIIRILANEVSFFPKETVLDLRRARKVNRGKLKEQFQKGILKFVGALPDEIMKQVDQIVTKSFSISVKDKKAILGKWLGVK